MRASLEQPLGEDHHDDRSNDDAATHGDAALALAREHKPRVILLGMRMPGMDGWEFVRRYRESPEPHAPIVVMTAAHSALRWGTEIRAAGVRPKPFELHQLLQVVEYHLQRG